MLYDENTGLMIAGTQPRGPYAEILLEKVNVERAPTWFAAVRSYIGVTRRITSVLRTTFSTGMRDCTCQRAKSVVSVTY